MGRAAIVSAAVVLAANLFCAASGCAGPAGLVSNPVGKACFWPSDYKPAHKRVQFVVFGDRTGGHVPGLTAQGIEEVNALHPEFVLAIGDQIEGYITVRTAGSKERAESQIRAEWTEYDSLAGRFQVPYFYLAGNHDCWDSTSWRIYSQLHGPTYYSFTVKGVHVVVLNSEEYRRKGFKGRGPLGAEQIEWLRKDLDANRDADLIVVALHRPLWRQSRPGDWLKVERMLQGRNYMVVAGHEHNYGCETRHGRPYIVVGPVAGSQKEEPIDALGVIRHVTLVTVEDGKPYVALIRLGSVLPADAVQQSGKKRMRALWANSRLDYWPEAVEPGKPVTIIWSLNNKQAVATRIEAAWPAESPWRIEPASFSATLEPGERREVRFRGMLRLSGPHQVPAMKVTLSWKDKGVEPVTFVWRARPLRQLPAVPLEAVKLDGRPEPGWEAAKAVVLERCDQAVRGLASWRGPDDLAAAIRAGCDGRFAYLLVEVTDDDLQAGDELQIYFAEPPVQQARPVRSRGVWRVFVRPAEGEKPVTLRGVPSRISCKAAVAKTSTGYAVEVAIPLEVLGKEGRTPAAVPFDLVVVDADEGQSSQTVFAWSGGRYYALSTRYWGALLLSGADGD